MTNTLSIAEARRNLPTLIRAAEKGQAVTLTRHGMPVAVLVGQRQYQRLCAGRRGFADAYGRFLQVTDLEELAIDPDEAFANTRESESGRDVRL